METVSSGDEKEWESPHSSGTVEKEQELLSTKQKTTTSSTSKGFHQVGDIPELQGPMPMNVGSPIPGKKDEEEKVIHLSELSEFIKNINQITNNKGGDGRNPIVVKDITLPFYSKDFTEANMMMTLKLFVERHQLQNLHDKRREAFGSELQTHIQWLYKGFLRNKNPLYTGSGEEVFDLEHETFYQFLKDTLCKSNMKHMGTTKLSAIQEAAHLKFHLDPDDPKKITNYAMDLRSI
jgi:hypothetical protein